MNKISTTLVCLCFAISTLSAQTYSGGSGTEADPYLISTKVDMEALATAVNGSNSYFGKYFLLMQDITDEITTIIGNSNPSTRVFRGIFDGGGHKVNVNISTTLEYAGVFVHAYQRDYQELGICRYSSSSTIGNCYNTGNISSAYASTAFVGGICGSGDTIINCISYNANKWSYKKQPKCK